MLAPTSRPRILYVASGPPPLALEVLDLLRQRFPEHQIDLVVSELCIAQLGAAELDQIAFIAGRRTGRLAFLRQAARTPYWLIAVVLSGHRGFLTMKLTALLIGLGRVVVCFNEHADAFALDRHHSAAILAYVTQRLGTRGGLGRGLVQLILRGLHNILGEPIGLVWMAVCVVVWRVHALLSARPSASG